MLKRALPELQSATCRASVALRMQQAFATIACAEHSSHKGEGPMSITSQTFACCEKTFRSIRFAAMAVNPSTPGAPADPVLQQGMSPSSTFVIEGESQGPDYGRTTLESLRTPLTEPGMRGAAQLPIGAVTATTVDGGAGTLGQSAVQSVEAAVAADDVQPCQLPRGHGTMVAEPSVRREDTGPVATMANFSGPGRDETLQGGSLFPQYMPSPLPGQSPVASQTGTTTRAAAWLSRLGDYLQRTVEVTSWTTHGSPNHAAQLPLQNVLPGQGRPGPSPTARTASAGVDHRPPSSNGSAGVSPELVQAEVARQLEAAMGEMQDRLRKERERSDEAVKEAQALRRQLDVHEMRAVLASRPLGSEGALVPPPGLADVVEPSPGVYTGVTSNHPPSVPALTGHPEARATVRPEDDYVQDRSYQGRAGAPSGVSQGVE